VLAMSSGIDRRAFLKDVNSIAGSGFERLSQTWR
jgi:hypothetical protein